MKRYKYANKHIHAPEKLKEQAAAKQTKAKRTLWPAAVAAVLALAILCGTILWPGGGSPLVQPVTAAAYEPDYAVRYDGTELDEVYLASIRQFAARAANVLLADENSAAYSPSALYTALSMVAELTEGNYLASLLDTLGTDGVDTLRNGTGDLWRYLCANPDIKEPGKVTLANSLWLSEDRQYNGDTLQTLADYYYVSSYTGDMMNDIPDQVSQWVQKQTNGLLDCRPETTPNTVAILLSAIYFYDEWAEPFNERETSSGWFRTQSGERAACNYMEREEESRAYYRGNGVTAAAQYFQNGSKMLFILPDEDNSPAEVLADTGLLASLLDWEGLDKETGTVEWFIPRFTLSSTLDLEDGLTALGLGELFDPDSNALSRLKADKDDVYISHAEQGTAISIDETGCEAASYVEIEAKDKATPWEEGMIFMYLNRPFVFAILSDNDVPLFIGTVGDLNG